MRVRISLLAPFGPSKVLVPIPNDVQTISQLKKHLFRSLSSIAQHADGWRQLRLEIEGFALLGGSELSVLEEGDVVSFVGTSATRAAERADRSIVVQGRARGF